jgi:hypothetical protein
MLGVAIELRTQCAKCGGVLPINAFAERYVCNACGNATVIRAGLWKSLLEDAIPDVAGMDEGEGKNRTTMTGGASYQMMIGRQAPRCSACKTTLPPEAFGFADRGFAICVGCGKKLSLRRAPAELAALGAQLVVGEDDAQLGGAQGSAPAASQTIVFYCANCKAPLKIDGSNRLVKCQYCSTDVYLPDDLWQRLHPVATVARWYLSMTAAHFAEQRKASWGWWALEDAVIDAQKNIYCVGRGNDDNGELTVWCMAPDLTTRWFARHDDLRYSHVHIALDPRGRLLVWWHGKHSAVVMSAADGSIVGKIGGKQPDDAKTHTFDLDDGKWLGFDADGTILALLYERFVRFDAEGGPLPTWPPRSGIFGKKQEKLRPVYGRGHERFEIDGKYIESVGNHPTELDDYTRLLVGWDGRLYAERSEWVACFDRTGDRVYRTKLPVASRRGDALGSDAAGNLYVLATMEGDPRPRVLVRVSPDGKRVDTIAGDRRTGGVIGQEEHLLVAPDGTIVLLRHYMCSRVLGPDGRLLFQSPASRQDDDKEEKQDAEKS